MIKSQSPIYRFCLKYVTNYLTTTQMWRHYVADVTISGSTPGEDSIPWLDQIIVEKFYNRSG